MEALTLFLWGENLEHVRVFGSSGGYRDKAIIISIKKGLGVLSLLSCKNLIQTGFECGRLKG
ncbi:hypothetical protein C2S07_05570 [Helicobacter pylori]|nr:hypothetical protein C2S07_05570 [Helicobacter pylori]